MSVDCGHQNSDLINADNPLPLYGEILYKNGIFLFLEND